MRSNATYGEEEKMALSVGFGGSSHNTPTDDPCGSIPAAAPQQCGEDTDEAWTLHWLRVQNTPIEDAAASPSVVKKCSNIPHRSLTVESVRVSSSRVSTLYPCVGHAASDAEMRSRTLQLLVHQSELKPQVEQAASGYSSLLGSG